MQKLLILVALTLPFEASIAAAAKDLPVTGQADQRLVSFDQMMLSFLKQHDLPGGSLAVAKAGRLVYARGFGYADVEENTPAEPTSLFRIASISKPITAVAIMQLVEKGKLKTDDRALDYIDQVPHLEEDQELDKRIERVTIGQLLNHTGGWDRNASFDPMFQSVRFAKTLGVPPPATADHVIRVMLGRKLDFDPGEKYAYSNFGYCLLGRVIEKITGQSYESYVREHLLSPAGITKMRIGATLLKGRRPNEVRYYTRGDRTGKAVMGPTVGAQVPQPYGAWHLEAMDSHGAWIASAVDLVRFATAVEQQGKVGPLVTPKGVVQMFSRPEGLPGHDADGKLKSVYYGYGWSVRPVGDNGRLNTWHGGSLPGTSTILVRRHDGLCWAVLFNSRDGADGQSPSGAIDPLVHRAADAVKKWPSGDLFESIR